MKIGILGGTFNPIHTGHMVLAQECWHRLSLDRVIFVPALDPPHKEVQGDISVADRLNIVRLALEGDDRFGISTYEIDSGGTSYSIDTVKYFLEKFGRDTELFFLSGADSLDTLSMWKDIDELMKLTTFIVAARPGWKSNTGSYEGRIRMVDIPLIEVSSSDVRGRVQEKQPIDFMVPGAVVKYIREKGLYRGSD